MKIEITPGSAGGVFDLPKPEWMTQSGRIELNAGLFAKKDRLVCAVCEPNERHCNVPPLGKADYLISEIYHLSAGHNTKLGKTLQKITAKISIPFYDSTNQQLNELSLRVYSKAKREDQWLIVSDVQFDIGQKMATFSAIPLGQFAVVGGVKEESFEITPNGCLYSSRLNHVISVRVPKGGLSQSAICTLRVIPICVAKMQQARTDYPTELGELSEISEMYDFDSVLVVDSASVQTSVESNPRASPNGLSSALEFKRQGTLKLPIPSWFNEATHSVDALALFYKLPGTDSWNYFTSKLKVHGSSLTINVPLLARFVIAMPKDAARVPRLIGTMARVDEYTSSFRGDFSAFVRYDSEKRNWDITVTWLRARDGEDRASDIRLSQYTDRLAANRWQPLSKVLVKPPDEDVPKKRVAWADGSGDKPESEQPAESADDAWNRMVNPQRRPRRSVVQVTTVPKLASLKNGAVVNIAIASDSQPNFVAVAGKTEINLLGMYEDLPDFSISTMLHGRPSADAETRVRSFVDSLTQFYNNQGEGDATMPLEPECLGEVRCMVQNPGNVLQKFVIAVFRLNVVFDDLLHYCGLQRPQPPPPPAPVPTTTPRESSPRADVESQQTAVPQAPPRSRAYEEMMRRIEEASKQQKSNSPPPDAGAEKPVKQRTELIRPRIAPTLIQPPREFSKEPRVLSGRSLQTLARHIEKGLTLGVFLNLKDSVISGIAFDSLSKMNASAFDVTYRVLLTWKRSSASRKLKHNQAGPALVDELVYALEQLGRPDLSESVKKAFADNAELQVSMVASHLVVT